MYLDGHSTSALETQRGGEFCFRASRQRDELRVGQTSHGQEMVTKMGRLHISATHKDAYDFVVVVVVLRPYPLLEIAGDIV